MVSPPIHKHFNHHFPFSLSYSDQNEYCVHCMPVCVCDDTVECLYTTSELGNHAMFWRLTLTLPWVSCILWNPITDIGRYQLNSQLEVYLCLCLRLSVCPSVRPCISPPRPKGAAARRVFSVFNSSCIRQDACMYVVSRFVLILNKMANYGRISKFMVSMEVSRLNASIYQVEILKIPKFN